MKTVLPTTGADGRSTRESFARRVMPTIRAEGDAAVTRACLQLMAEHLVDCIKAEFQSDRYVLLDWPNHNNIGDRVIHVAELYLLGKHCRAQCVYSAHFENLDVGALKGIPPEVPILFHGGGNLGDLWPRHQKFRETVIEQFPERRFTLLPQSMHFTDSAALERASRLFRSHANLVVFLRDWRSFELAVEYFGAERVRLAPDMAIALAGLMPLLLAGLGVTPRFELLHLFRTDKELSAKRPMAPQGARISDWQSMQPGWDPKLDVHGAAKLAADAGLSEVLNVPGGMESWRFFILGLRQILKAKHVVTDRLHAHVLAMLGGRPNVLHANDHHKIRAFYETWMEGLSLCRFEG